MTADDFVKIVRAGAEKLRVDNIVLNTGEREVHGKGMLRIGREEIRLDMTLDAGENAPPRQTGVFTKSDYWKLIGVIEDNLQFKCDYVSGGGSQTSINWKTRTEVLSFHLNPIELIPSGWDALSREERERIQEDLNQRNKSTTQNNPEDGTAAKNSPASSGVRFFAKIYNYPIPTLLCLGTDVIRINPYFGEGRSGRLDTLMGEIEGYKYAFIKDKADADFEVYLESKGEYRSSGEQEDWKKFFGLMKALAFVSGMHAWPYRIEYWRDGQKITDRVTPARRLANVVHAPFHLLKFDFQEVIKKATNFFETEAKLNEEVAEILFLFREAADYEQVHGEITLIALCVLFESLVNQLFKELKLEEKERQQGVEKFNMRERFQAVANHFKLPWHDDMESVFKTWQRVRDPLIHGKGRTNQTEAQSKDAMIAESQIAGAMNVLILKLIGYSGRMSASVFEEKYREV